MKLQPAISRRTLSRRQSGAATLIVVMVLFFVISLVAAYAGRNILFEQRTSANQMQGTTSFEAAEAGMEWAMALLNSGRITENCTPSGADTDPSFRDRYLTIDNTTGNIVPQLRPPGVPPAVELWAACASNGGGWACRCPASGAPVLPAPGAGLTPAFAVRFVTLNAPLPLRPGIVRVEVKGCTQPDPACLTFEVANPVRCQGTVCAMAALMPGLKSRPVAAITARGNVDVGLTNPLGAFNTAAQASGLTVRAGGAVSSNPFWQLAGAPGTPADQTIMAGDSAFAAGAPVSFTADRMFAASFGVWRETYWQQPGAVRLACGGGCDGTAVRDAIRMNPGRVVLADGNVDLDGGTDIGTLAEPVVLVVKGNLTFSAATNVFGFVYAETAGWTTGGAGPGTVRGAVVAEGNLGGTGNLTVVYEPDVLEALSRRTGSFVRVPGSWRDFP